MTVDTRNKIPTRYRLRSWLLSALTISVAAFMGLAPARAQTMDYESLEQLFGEPVTISATGLPQRVTEVPANMIIVTADEIRRSGARDIPGVLRHVAGVDIMQWASDDSDVSIRGYNQAYASRMVVLIDGRQVYADFYGFVPWSAVPVELSAIRQIEIVKGPNAALFGFNAVGGVINIVTYDPLDDVNTASLRGGTRGLAEISGVATFKLGDKGGLRLSGGLRSDDEFTTPIPPAMAGPQRIGNERAAIDANAFAALGNNVEIGFEASHTHARQNEVYPGYLWQNAYYETNSLKGQLAADTGAGLLKFTAYTNWLAWRGVSNPQEGVYSFHNDVTVVQVEDSFNLGADHTLRAALEYRHGSVNTTPIPGGNVFYDVMSASAMWNWRISHAISLTNALRVDRLTLGRSGILPADYPFTNADWDRSITQFSFNSGVVWAVTPGDTVRLIVSRGTQLPNLVEFGALIIDTPYVQVTGYPALKPTAVTNYELAWDRNMPAVGAHLQISAFEQRIENIISVAGNAAAGAGSYYITAGNIGSSDAAGLELSAKGALDDAWRWSFSYRAEIVEDDFLPVAQGGTDFVDYQHTTPKHLIKAGVGWASGSWEADTYLTYQSNTVGLQRTDTGSVLVPVGAYASLDGCVAYRLTNWATIAISGQNLLSSSQRQTSGPAVERQIFATLSVND